MKLSKWVLIAAVGIQFLGGMAFATTDYSIPQDDIVALLDEEYYLGNAGQFGAPVAAAGRWAYFASLNNAGTKVAFLGLDLATNDQRLFIVNVGDPASWRQVNAEFDAGLTSLIWSPDDVYIGWGEYRINPTTGVPAGAFYTYPESAGLDVVSDSCVSSVFSFEFDTNGDAEGWDLGVETDAVSGVTASGGSLTGTITNIDPEIGAAGFSVDPSTVTHVVIRMRVDTITDRAQVGWGHTASPIDPSKFLQFDTGRANEWHTFVLDVNANPNWNIGQNVDLFRIDVSQGGGPAGTFEIDYIRFCTTTNFPASAWNVAVTDAGEIDHIVRLTSSTVDQSANIALGTFLRGGTGELVVFGIGTSLNTNTATVDYTELTNFAGAANVFSDAALSNDGTLLTFGDVTYSTQPDFGMPGYENDIVDVYTFDDVAGVIAGSSLAPATLADPRIHEIRTQSEGGSRYKTLAKFSPDKSLVVYGEDFNDQFVNDQGFGTADSFTRGDFDVMLSTPLGNDGPPIDSANSSDDRQFADTGNQFISAVSKNGLRLLWQSQSSLAEPLRIFIATFVQTTTIDDVVTVPEGTTEVTIGGEMQTLPFVPTDSAVQVDVETAVMDSSGTMVMLPEDQVINFPEGSGVSEISIATPTEPTEQAQLPTSGFVSAVPIQREFGPEGTEFFPPIEITITYLDAEIVGLDESSVTPFLFNEDTGIYDIPVPESDIVLRDPINNKVVFRVDHFSTYGLGFVNPASLPASGLTGLLIAIGLIAGMAAIALTIRRRA